MFHLLNFLPQCRNFQSSSSRCIHSRQLLGSFNSWKFNATCLFSALKQKEEIFNSELVNSNIRSFLLVRGLSYDKVSHRFVNIDTDVFCGFDFVCYITVAVIFHHQTQQHIRFFVDKVFFNHIFHALRK